MDTNNLNLFLNYNDVLKVEDLQKILGIGKNLAYQLLTDKKIIGKKVGHSWIIAKSNLIKFILSEDENASTDNI